jgi:hypothetical protein
MTHAERLIALLKKNDGKVSTDHVKSVGILLSCAMNNKKFRGIFEYCDRSPPVIGRANSMRLVK